MPNIQSLDLSRSLVKSEEVINKIDKEVWALRLKQKKVLEIQICQIL